MEQTENLQLATVGSRIKAAFLDGVIITVISGLLMIGLALMFPNYIAFPFITITKTEEISRDVKKDGNTLTTELVYKEMKYDIRNRLISECLMKATIKKSPNLETKYWSNIEPCKFGITRPNFLIWIVIILYGTYFEMAPRSATPGKRLLGIRVVKLDGRPLSLARALGRNLAEFLSYILFIGYLVAFFTSRRQTLHDLIARTLVVKSAPSEEHQKDARKSD